jgi:hypothetical protein
MSRLATASVPAAGQPNNRSMRNGMTAMNTTTEEEAMCTTAELAVRELDRRTNDGIDVRLLWSPQTNRVSVAVEDGRAGEYFELEVDAADALAAFRHSYAYAHRDHSTHALAPPARPHGRR